MTQWSMVSPFLSLLALYAQLPGVSARRGGDGSGGGGNGGGGRPGVAANSNSGPGDLNLEGINAALFSFYIIFAIISTIQTLQALHLLSQRNTNANGSGSTPPFSTNTGIAYRILLLLTPLTLVAAYTMGAIYIGVDLSENYYNRLRRYASHFTPGFYACINFLPVLAEVFFAAALLVLIRHRARINQVSYWSGKTVIDGSLVLLLLICSIATTAIRTTTVTPANFDSMRNAYNVFTHLYVAFYILMAVNIVATTISVRSKTRHLVVQDQILRSIALFICPLLAIRAIYKLISDILLWIPQNSIDYQALSLASLIILGFTFAIIIGVAVRLGLRGKAAARTGTVLQLPQQGKVLYTKGY